MRWYLVASLTIAVLLAGVCTFGKAAETPEALVLDEFTGPQFNKDFWRVVEGSPRVLRSDGAARLTYREGRSYRQRANLTTVVPLPRQYVVMVNMLGGVQTREIVKKPGRVIEGWRYIGDVSIFGEMPTVTAPPAEAAAPPIIPAAPEEGVGEGFIPPRFGPGAGGMPGPGEYMRRFGAMRSPAAPRTIETPPAPEVVEEVAAPQSLAAQLRQIASEVLAEKPEELTVTGHFIRPTSYAPEPSVGVALLAENSSLAVTFRPAGVRPAGLEIRLIRGRTPEVVERIAVPAGSWVPTRLDVDGTHVIISIHGKRYEVELPSEPTKVQVGDIGPEVPFKVTEKVEYLIDDVRIYAGAVQDLPSEDYIDVGEWFVERGDYANAAIEFERAVAASPGRAGARVMWQYAKAYLEGLEETLSEAEQAVAASPNSFEAHLYLGRLYLDAMRYGDATEELEVAVELAPDSPEANMWLGLALFQREARFPGEKLEADKKAFDHLNTALFLKPTFAHAYEALGLCHFELGKFSKAQGPLVKALELNPYLFEARLALMTMREAERPLGDEELIANTKLLIASNRSFASLLLTFLAEERRPAEEVTPPEERIPTERRGVVGPPEMQAQWGQPVYRTLPAGEKYHRAECPHLKGRHAVRITLADAFRRGLEACADCNPPPYPPMRLPGVAGQPRTSPQPVTPSTPAVSFQPRLVDRFQYFERADSLVEKGLPRPAVAEYRWWMLLMRQKGRFEQMTRCAEAMADAYKEASMPGLQAYSLYLPTELRRQEEWGKVRAYAADHKAEFDAAYYEATGAVEGLRLTPTGESWLLYANGVMTMGAAKTTSELREAVDIFKSAIEIEDWDGRGDTLMQLGNCYLLLRKPYLAEAYFEQAYTFYQDQLRLLVEFGIVERQEYQRLTQRVRKAAQYVNFARARDGKGPKYQVEELVLEEISAPPLPVAPTAAPPRARVPSARGFIGE